jgi:hypothetical protein
MENFQLYRTNILLGGQMKWDICINDSADGLVVTDFHLSPISNNIPYTHNLDVVLLNNKHEDNVKEFYKTIKGNFYSDGMSAEFQHNWPIIVNKGEKINTYNDICDMGCKPMKNFDLYGKQFEFLCPVWIEHLYDDLNFIISVKDRNTNNTISSKTLNLSLNNNENRFNKYFNDWIKTCKLDEGNDNVLFVDLKKDKAFINGFNVNYGVHFMKDIHSSLESLTTRERPLLEFDNIILSNFWNNEMIVNQLFNFNLCFNIDDILSSAITSEIYGVPLKISIEVYIGNDKLKLKDFNTEYEYIPKQIVYNDGTGNSEYENINVLNYLLDYKCLDLVSENKYSQQTFHWSLCDNSDYIFNLYDGFSGYSIIDGKIIENEHSYGNTPSTDEELPIPEKNNLGWINRVELNAWRDFYELISKSIPNDISICSVFHNSKFVNGLKYNYLPQHPLCTLGVVVTPLLFSKIKNEYSSSIISLGTNFAVYIQEFYVDKKKHFMVLLITVSENNLTFYSFKKRLEPNIQNILKNENGILSEFVSTFISFEPANIIVIPNTVSVDIAKGPSKKIDELCYYKNDGETNYVARYDGKLKPNFINNRKIYFKDYISDDRTEGVSNLQKSKYAQYVNTGFEPFYKSIDYCSILSTDIDYTNIPNVSVSEHDNVSLINTVEHKWFNDSVVIGFLAEHNISLIIDDTDDVNDAIKDYLESYHNISETSPIDKQYIYDKYNVYYDWEYLSLTNVNQYKYKIKLRLK